MLVTHITDCTHSPIQPTHSLTHGRGTRDAEPFCSQSTDLWIHTRGTVADAQSQTLRRVPEKGMKSNGNSVQLRFIKTARMLSHGYFHYHNHLKNVKKRNHPYKLVKIDDKRGAIDHYYYDQTVDPLTPSSTHSPNHTHSFTHSLTHSPTPTSSQHVMAKTRRLILDVLSAPQKYTISLIHCHT